MTAPEAEWRELLRCVAEEHCGEVPRKPRLVVGGEVVAWWESIVPKPLPEDRNFRLSKSDEEKIPE